MEDARDDRDGQSRHPGNEQNGLLREGQIARDPFRQNRFDPALEIRPGNTCHADRGRFDVPLADGQDSFGVFVRIVACGQHVFVAGTFALLHEPGADPPGQGVEPEHRFDGHVNRREEVVPASGVAKLVRDDCRQLSGKEVLRDFLGQQKDGVEDAGYARLQESRERRTSIGNRDELAGLLARTTRAMRRH